MAARYWNVPARPLLTAAGILAAFFIFCFILATALGIGYPPGRGGSAEGPVFARRMDVLPAIVVTAPAPR